MSRLKAPVWVFHGTDVNNIDNIVRNGLLVPGFFFYHYFFS